MLKPFDLNGLKTYELASRPSKVFVEDLGQPVAWRGETAQQRRADVAAGAGDGDLQALEPVAGELSHARPVPARFRA